MKLCGSPGDNIGTACLSFGLEKQGFNRGRILENTMDAPCTRFPMFVTTMQFDSVQAGCRSKCGAIER